MFVDFHTFPVAIAYMYGDEAGPVLVGREGPPLERTDA